MTNQYITVGAVVEGECQLLEFFVEELKQNHKIHSTEYGSKNGTSWVKCRIDNRIYMEFRKLINLVAADLNVNEAELYNFLRHKTRRLVFARDLMAFILRTRYDLSFCRIARLMKAKSHASALLSCRKFDSSKLKRIKSCTIEIAYIQCKQTYKKGVENARTVEKKG